jgi:V-type H+-transporting ATPase subunit C
MSFYYISAPELLGSREATIKEIREGVINRGLSKGGELNLKKVNFKMANLDTLMFCNDKALKLESLLEALLKKIDKQFCDLAEKQSHEWWVKGEKELPVRRYFCEFVWNESKFQTDKPILHIISFFESRLATIENLLRTNTTQYNEAKQQLSQLVQKEYELPVAEETTTSKT